MAGDSFGLAKILRLGMMLRQMLSEQDASPLDADAVSSLTDIYRHAVEELKAALPDELNKEFERLSMPFEQPDGLTESEVRMANAQLLGWLDGVTQGIRMALMAAQTAQEEGSQDPDAPNSLPASPENGQYL
jgi:hypothetical protein